MTAFRSGKEGARDVWRVSVDGGDPRPVGIAMIGLRDLSMHPDGPRLAFTAGWPVQELWVGENFLADLKR